MAPAWRFLIESDKGCGGRWSRAEMDRIDRSGATCGLRREIASGRSSPHTPYRSEGPLRATRLAGRAASGGPARWPARPGGSPRPVRSQSAASPQEVRFRPVIINHHQRYLRSSAPQPRESGQVSGVVRIMSGDDSVVNRWLCVRIAGSTLPGRLRGVRRGPSSSIGAVQKAYGRAPDDPERPWTRCYGYQRGTVVRPPNCLTFDRLHGR